MAFLRGKIKSDAELKLRIVEGLRTAARRPNIYGYVPHPKQEIFHKSQARGRQFIGGNRSGKTVGGGVESIWNATGKHPWRPVAPPPTHGRVVAIDFIEGVEKIVKPEIARWLPPSELINGSWEDSYRGDLRTLTLANGSTMEFMSYDQAVLKFAGTSRHWTWFDEEPPQDIFIECLMRLIDTGGSWWMTMTPVEGMTWTYDEIYEKANPAHPEYDPNLFVVEVDSHMNPHINEGEISKLLAGLDANERKARLHGQYIQRGGLIYPNFNEAVHVINPVHPAELHPDHWLHFASMDQGINNPTSWHWHAINREGKMITYDEYYKANEIVEVHAAEVLIREANHRITPAYRVGDPSIKNRDPVTGTSVLIAYTDAGVDIMLGNNDVIAGINSVRRKLGGPDLPPSWFICANNPMLIWEMKRYRWALWANKKMDREKNPKEEPHKKDDHAVDDARYAIASRPEVEDLRVPEQSRRPAGGGSVSPYHGRTDPATTRPDPKYVLDDILGSEW